MTRKDWLGLIGIFLMGFGILVACIKGFTYLMCDVEKVETRFVNGETVYVATHRNGCITEHTKYTKYHKVRYTNVHSNECPIHK